MRNYYFVTSEKPTIKGKMPSRLNIIKTWRDEGKPQGYFEKCDDSPVFVNMEFTTDNGKRINCEHTLMGQALGMIAEFLTKEDLVGLCEIFYLWG